MQFSTEGDVTVVRFDWKVDTTESWMNILAPVARPLFRWNHGTIMEWGGQGLGQRLGAELVASEER